VAAGLSLVKSPRPRLLVKRRSLVLRSRAKLRSPRRKRGTTYASHPYVSNRLKLIAFKRKNKPKPEGGETSNAEGTADEQAPKKPRARKPKVQRPPRPVGEDPEGEPSKTMLFVANLGFNIDDAGLSALFTEAGVAVVSARIVRRRWGHPRRSKGYGFVDVGGEEEQKKAIQLLQNKEVGGRNIAVKIAVNKDSDENDEENVNIAAAPVEA